MTAESLISIALGLGLAAATGFRAFLPLLIAAIAARVGWLPLSESFEWLASTAALVTLAAAAVFETLAYYIPGVDHALDLLAGPIAIAAGVIASASVMVDIPEAAVWPIALILGGGAAGATKGAAALVRGKTGIATAGLGNPVVSTAENVSAVGVSVLAIALPVLCLIGVAAALIWAFRKLKNSSKQPRA